MEKKVLSMGDLLAAKGVSIDNSLAGLIITKIVPDASGQKKVGIEAKTADGKNTKRFECGYKVLEMGFAFENDKGEQVINDGFELQVIQGRNVAIKTGSNNRESKFNWEG